MRERCRVIEARLTDVEEQKAAYLTSLMHHRAVLAEMEAEASDIETPPNMSIRGHFKPGELFALSVIALREHGPEQSTRQHVATIFAYASVMRALNGDESGACSGTV